MAVVSGMVWVSFEPFHRSIVLKKQVKAVPGKLEAQSPVDQGPIFSNRALSRNAMTPSFPQAEYALELVNGLQARFVAGLEKVAAMAGSPASFSKTEWLRDEGRHGRGQRFSAPEGGIFNRASVNVSQIHYEDLPEKKLGSATAISTIIHPDCPHAPSMHMHISRAEMKDGSGYWRIMGDLNPSVVHEEYRDRFARCMREAAPGQYEEAAAQGDRYFYIPALGRHRGATHFYLESYRTDDAEADRVLARRFGEAVIDGYLEIIEEALSSYREVDEEARAEQLAYHTLYFFQVLTLDRGTTSGLLVHDQNDLGIMGSLPSHVDRDLLATWEKKVPVPQEPLVQGLIDALPYQGRCEVTDAVKLRLAGTVREHYRSHPEALALQAAGNVIPPTVENHGK